MAPIATQSRPETSNGHGVVDVDISQGVLSLTEMLDPKALRTSAHILRVIDRYKLPSSSSTCAKPSSRADEGYLRFLPIIYSHVKASRPICLCLPAFPFKSPNSTRKVLGRLPDKAEEVALAHLNGLCLAIGDLYPPGAKLTIISDGLVYNDLLGVPDKDVWAYGEALRAIARDKGHDKNIIFSRLKDLVNLPLPEHMDEMTYVANASNFRRALLNTYMRPDWEWSEVRRSEDVCATYRGYIKFLETDLEYVFPQGKDRSRSRYKRGIEYIARQMLARGDAFANAVSTKYKDHVRLSIHASTEESKLSISLLPTDTIYTTPWHCSVAFRLDGTVTSGMRADFEASPDNFELVYREGRPSHFRERSDLFSWAEDKGGVTMDPLYPSGVMIRPVQPGAINVQDIDAEKVRALAETNSPIVLRDFCKRLDREEYLNKAHDLGKPLPWKFGLVLEVKDQGSETAGLNNVLSSEWMPFHFDGLFKTKTCVDEQGREYVTPDPPRFQFFAGVTGSPKNTGFTIFSSSTLVFKYLPSWLSVDALAPLTWSFTSSSWDPSTMSGLPLIVAHPTTGRQCLRYHEPWPQEKTKFDATTVTIEGQGLPGSSEAICAAIDETLHDRRVAYYHAWEQGDLVVSDNVLMMHTRSDFTAGSDRELWRVHFD